MVATTGLIGSSGFRYFIGTKKECKQWLITRAEICKDQHQGAWYSVYSPARIISNKEAAKLRYRDGNRVIEF